MTHFEIFKEFLAERGLYSEYIRECIEQSWAIDDESQIEHFLKVIEPRYWIDQMLDWNRSMNDWYITDDEWDEHIEIKKELGEW